MILITGGAYQGKTQYAVDNFGLMQDDIADGNICTESEILNAKCVSDYHIFIKRMLEKNTDVISFTNQLCEINKNLIVIMNEIGCGIIPIEKEDRIWRETAGKCGCIIAQNSKQAVRIINSIPMIIKDEP